MSGPVTAADAPPGEPGCGHPDEPEVEVTPSREAAVGGVAVRRALPRRTRRTVGAWCFADHFGPAVAGGPAGADAGADTGSGGRGMGIGPHPHTGLHTVTWLVEGELLHRDSLGSEQLIRPGQLNLMTAGGGVSHAEETPARWEGRQHGIQLWVAQPDATRHGPPAFEHHAELPAAGLGAATATVLIGALAGAASAARADTPLLGAELASTGGGGAAEVPLDPAHEHALVVLAGTVAVGATPIEPGRLAYLGRGREALALHLDRGARALVIGGRPFGEDIVMSWNFVGRTRDEMAQDAADWNAGADRFGTVASPLARIAAPEPR
jgi:redox-sensitive bicupin YhaK (pirin superfamily)